MGWSGASWLGLCRPMTLPSPPSAVPPLPSLIPGPPLEEGQGLTLAASCTAEGSPAPRVTWDTEVKGTTSNRSFKHSRSAAVTSEFHLVPSRSMNGQPLTCVVSHPGLLQDQRITHTLQVACKYLYLDAWVGRLLGSNPLCSERIAETLCIPELCQPGQPGSWSPQCVREH
jgi:hypothetical protein